MTHATIPPFPLRIGRAGEAIELSPRLDDRLDASWRPSFEGASGGPS